MRHVRSKAAYRTSYSKDVHLISVPIQTIPAETYCGRVSKWWSANDQCSERHRWRPRPNIPVDRKNPNVSSRSTKKVHSAPYIARYLPSWHRWDGPHGVWLLEGWPSDTPWRKRSCFVGAKKGWTSSESTKCLSFSGLQVSKKKQVFIFKYVFQKTISITYRDLTQPVDRCSLVHFVKVPQ